MYIWRVQVLFSGGVCRRGLNGGWGVVAGGRGMKRVALSLPKPPGSSLVPLHMTWLSFFESISSSTLTLWMLAKRNRERTEKRKRELEVQNVA